MPKKKTGKPNSKKFIFELIGGDKSILRDEGLLQ
jgi:hypothetical protein